MIHDSTINAIKSKALHSIPTHHILLYDENIEVYLSIYQSIIFIYLSIILSFHLSIHLSVYRQLTNLIFLYCILSRIVYHLYS